MTPREQAREAALAVWMQRYEDQVKAEPPEHSGVLADAASDVWEQITAAHRLKEAGVDLDRLVKVLESSENWGHLVHAYEVLAVLGAVRLEMEAMWPKSEFEATK